MKSDPNLMNCTISISNDSVGNSVVNASYYIMRTVYNHIVLFEFRLPESTGDIEYRRIVFRSKLDFSKLIKGVRGNSYIESFFKVILDHIDFEMKAPFYPGYYRFINLSIPDIFPFKTKFLIKINVTSIFARQKRKWIAYGEYKGETS